MGSAAGAEKVAAARLGMSVAEYRAKHAAGSKWCSGCGAWHPTAEFGRDRSRPSGLAPTCGRARQAGGDRPGTAERRRRAARGFRWCRGCRTWLTADLVEQGACRPHVNAEARRMYAGRPAEVSARKGARRRRLAVVPTWWRAERFEEFGGLCAYGCGRPAAALDHVWPVARGGESRPANLVPSCGSCNASKGARDPEPWIGRGARAFPAQWAETVALGCEHGIEWEECA